MGKKKHRRGPRPVAAIATGVITFKDRQFRVREPSGMRLMLFGKVAETIDEHDIRAMAETYDLLEDLVDPGDWQRFVKHALDTRATVEDLARVFQSAVEVFAGRPTQRPTGSSGGPSGTAAPSTDGSSSQVIQRELDRDRPDLAHAVWLAQQDRQRADLRAV